MIKFIDLKTQQIKIRSKVENKIKKILDHGQYILGPEVDELQSKLSKFCGSRYVLCCSSGTDALLLGLLGLGLKPGDGVLVPSFTFASSAEVMPLLGAIPIFVDVDKSNFNISANSIQAGIDTAKKKKINLKGIMTVGLFGQPCNMDEINKIANKNQLWVLDDAAQSLGATFKGKPVGNLAKVTATSFFPSKPLGCYGDGGAIFTNSKKIYDIAYSTHLHGMGKDRYTYERLGMNGRMDSIQAAIIIEKLKIFQSELKLRNKVANQYIKVFTELKTKITLPKIISQCTSNWAQFTIILPNSINREALREKLSKKQIPTAIYYPIPLHKQKPYKNFPVSVDGLKNTEYLCKNVISLPMHPYLTFKEITFICKNIHQLIN